MWKHLKRILFFLTIFLSLFIVKEILALYGTLYALHPVAAWAFLGLAGVATVYFVLIPVVKLVTIRVMPGPTTDRSKEDALIRARVKQMKRIHSGDASFDLTSAEDYRSEYDAILKVLKKKSSAIRKRYVMRVFYGTGIVQNGFIDAFIILSANVAMVKELFVLYNGRVSNRDLLKIGRQVYYSMAIGGSEAVEYGVEELFSKVASKGIQAIPFLDKISSSVADGYVNSFLTTRVAMITENYCSLTYIEKESELYPSTSVLVKTTQSITSGLVNNIMDVLKNTATNEKTTDFLLKAANPVGFVFEKAIDLTLPDKEDSNFKSNLKSGASFIGNPIIFGVDRWVRRKRQSRKPVLPIK